MNIYAYVRGDPVNGSDPSGMFAPVPANTLQELVVTASKRAPPSGHGTGGGNTCFVWGGGAGCETDTNNYDLGLDEEGNRDTSGWVNGNACDHEGLLSSLCVGIYTPENCPITTPSAREVACRPIQLAASKGTAADFQLCAVAGVGACVAVGVYGNANGSGRISKGLYIDLHAGAGVMGGLGFSVRDVPGGVNRTPTSLVATGAAGPIVGSKNFTNGGGTSWGGSLDVVPGLFLGLIVGPSTTIVFPLD